MQDFVAESLIPRVMKGKSGAPGESRTPDLLVRSQTLYPAELRALRVDVSFRTFQHSSKTCPQNLERTEDAGGKSRG